jgi:catechol 2,3-dioxygenase
MTIDTATTIGAVHLTISNLERSVAFYETQLGFKVDRRDVQTAWLGAAGPDLLVLSHCETAPKVRGTTGLYHFAVLVPSRIELAYSLRRLIETDTLVQGFADHGVSEAIYLADPDGNGIEIYRDRPRGAWPYVAGRLQMGAAPLDVDHVLKELETSPSLWSGLARDTTIGHIHLHVSHLPDAEKFYVEVIGFDLMQRYGSGALFVSAGGYHHHIGLNTWAGVGAPPPPAGALGLRYFVLKLPTDAALAQVVDRVQRAGIVTERRDEGLLLRDPAGNAMLLTMTAARSH